MASVRRMAVDDRFTRTLHWVLQAGMLVRAVRLLAGMLSESRKSSPVSTSRLQAEASISRGDYRGAERAARELIASLEQDPSADSRDLARARDLLVEALLGG